MSYRQLLKATNLKVNNQKFKTYLKMFYKENRKNNIKRETINAWIQMLYFVDERRAQKLGGKKIQEKTNLNSLFIKHPTFKLSSAQYEKVTRSSNEKNAYNIFMMCEIYYLWNERRIFGKKLVKNQEQVDFFFRQKKTFQIDQNEVITFV